MRKLFTHKFYISIFFAVGLYLVVLFSFYVFSNSLIYQRTTILKSYQFNFNQPYQEYFIKTPDNATINALYFKTNAKSKGLIFYLHGNADNLIRWGKYASDFTDKGYDVFMMDYRGYGKSTGSPKEIKLYQDAAFVLNWVSKNIPYSHLIIYGRSLGAAVASQLASKAEPSLLILETPFAELSDVIYWPLKPALLLFPMEARFSNLETIAKVKCGKVIFHGTRDWVVPLSSAKKLEPLLDQTDQFILIEGGGHRNLSDFKSYHDKLTEILNRKM